MTETNSERLNRIKEIRRIDYGKRHDGFLINLGIGEVNWLIEQAERAQELEASCNVSNCLKKFNSKTEIENKRLKKALYVAFFHAVESQSDGTVDVITDTLQGLDYMDMWDADYEKGKKLFEEWMK